MLSVFNGFQDVLGGKLDQLSADVKVTSLKGKVIESADSLIDLLESLPEVAMVMPMVEDNALAIYNRRQLPVRIQGVDADKYSSMTAIRDLVKEDGKYALISDVDEAIDVFADSVSEEVLDENALFAYADELYADEPITEPMDDYQAIISVGVAVSLKAHPDDSKSLGLYVPRRLGMVNMRWYVEECRLEDLSFIVENRPALAEEFKVKGKKIRYIDSIHAAKDRFKRRLGNLDDKFLDIIPKSLAFKPMDNVKEFINKFVLSEEIIDDFESFFLSPAPKA